MGNFLLTFLILSVLLFVVGFAPFGNKSLAIMDAELFLDAKFHRQAMSVPSCPSVDFISALCLVAAYGILDRTRHDMVNARHAVR